jgi:hypothetical protein
MELLELLRKIAETLDGLGIPYYITGSVASGAYGEPRLTNDIDVVAALRPEHVDAILAAFPPPEFYCSRDAMTQAISADFQFNVLHPATGMKVDVILPGRTAFDRARLQRIRRIDSAGSQIAYASPEDVILKKLVYFKEGGSEKHLRDIVGILKVQGEQIERAYLAEWVASLGVGEEWQLVMSRMPPANGGKP